MDKADIVLIGREEDHTHVLYNALSGRFNLRLVYEKPPAIQKLLRWRTDRLGWPKVAGQLLFHFLVALPMGALSAKRKAQILREAGLSATAPPAGSATRTPSVNSRDLLDQIHQMAPRLIVISGTRILTAGTLAALRVPVINVHVGIAPKYRGVHGAYWALAHNDPGHCGVTVHLVDEGLDTGLILKQGLITPGRQDNFTTYPALQMAAGSALLGQAIEEVLSGTAVPLKGPANSQRWYHPTLWEYAWNYMRKGVR